MRFLALVSNGERLAELSEKAANAEDAATLQVLKTMDSIDAKTQQLKTSLQSLYVSSGVQNFFKGILDFGNEIVKTFTRMPTVLNLPIPAILKIGTTFASLANVVSNVFAIIKTKLTAQESALTSKAQKEAIRRTEIRQQEATSANAIMEQVVAYRKAFEEAMTKNQALESDKRIRLAQQEAEAAKQAVINRQTGINTNITTPSAKAKNSAGYALGLNIAGVALSTIAGTISDKTRGGQLAKGFTGIASSTASMAGLGTTIGGFGIGTGVGAVIGTVMGLIENMNFLLENTEARANRLKEAAAEANNNLIQKNAIAKDLKDQIKQYKELEQTQYDSVEARESFIEVSNRLAEQFPEIVNGYDSEGNAIIEVTRAYDQLIAARREAIEAAKEAASASTEETENAVEEAEKNRSRNRANLLAGKHGEIYDREQNLTYGFQASDYAAQMDSLIYDENLAEQVQNLFNIQELLNQLSDANTLEVAQSRLESSDIINSLNELRNSEDETIIKIVDFIDSYTAGLINVQRDIETKRDQNEIREQSVLYNLIDKTNQYQIDVSERNNEKTALSELSTASTLIDNYMWQQFENYKKILDENPNQKDANKTDLQQFIDEQYDEIYQKFYSNLESIWNDVLITDDKKKEFTDLFSKIGSYTQDQITNKLIEEFGIYDEDILNSIEEYYINTFDAWKFKEAIQKREENDSFLRINDNFNSLFLKLGSDELKSILDTYDSIDKGIKNNTISRTYGQNILQSYLTLWETSAKITDETTREITQSLLAGADFTSLSGLTDFQKAVSESTLPKEIQQQLLDISDQLFNKVPKNLVAEYGSLEATLTSNISDLEKALNNAANGMDSKTALEMANKLGLTLNNFEFKNGKYFYDKTNDLISKYSGVDEKLVERINAAYEDSINLVNDLESLENDSLIKWFKGGYTNKEGQNVTFEALDAETQLEAIMLRSGADEEQAKQLLEYYNQYYNDFLNVTEEYDNNFWKYVKEQVEQSRENFDKLIENVDYINNVNILKSGDIGLFISNLKDLTPDKVAAISNAYNTKDLDTLLQLLPEYSSTLIEIFENLSKNIYSNIISGITSDGLIKTTDTTDVFYRKYLYGDNAILKQVAENTYKFIGDSYQVIIDDIKADETLTNEERNNLLKTIHTDQFKDNIYTALSGVIDKFDSFSYEAGQALATALGGDDIDALIKQGIVNEDVAGNLSISYTQMLDYLNQNILELGVKQYNDLRAKLEALNDKQRNEVIFKDIIKNRDSLSAANVSSLATMLKIPYDTVLRLLKDNGNGTYSIDLTRIQILINQGKITVTDEIEELMADEIDKVISSITGLAGSQSKGYTNLADMQKFVNNLNKATGSNYGFQDLFEYSDILHAYQLSTQGIITQIQTMKNQLSNMTKEQQEIAKQLIIDTARQFAEQIDISGYLSLNDTDPAKTKKEQEVMLAIHDYNMAVEAIGEGTVLYTDQIMNSLKEGGLKAIEAARTVAEAAGKTLTAEEVEAAYRSEASQLTDAFEQLVYEPGVIIDNTAAEILRQAGYGIQEIEGTGQSLITSVGKLNRAYRGYLRKLQQTGEATLVDLNEATAMVLETNKGEESDAISALSKAADMTYAEFAEIFTKAGIELTETMVTQLDNANIIKRIGGGKMQILNWNAFADLMGWTDLDSEEYVSAFKTYNDALIEMNRKAERNIVEEIQSIGDAKAGDVINLTQYSSDLDEETRAALEEKLKEFNATLVDGLLVLDDGANIPAIIQAIIDEAGQSGRLLQDHMVELADTLNEVLENYANLIGNGIEGKLTNAQALDLQQQAMGMGAIDQLNELDFVKTADGLKLSSDSAAKLYNNLKNVDVIKSRLVFDKLYSSITTSDERLKSMSGTMNRISEIQKQIAKNERDIAGLRATKSDGKADAIEKENEELREQLQLYKDIRYEQMDDADSYAFMDRVLPEQFQGAENYFNSVGKAFKAINEAGETGYMDIADFYNFISEASELVELSGKSIDLWGMKIDGSAENCAALIERGFGALSNVDGEGVKVDLQRLGVNFKNGADGMAGGFTEGVKSLAKSQIELIDAEIAMLETFVALQALDELDTDNDGLIELVDDELVTVDKVSGKITGFTKKYTDVMDKIKKSFIESNNKDIQNAWKNLRINGHDLNELFSASTEQLQQWGISLDEWESILNALNKLVHSDEFADKPGELIASIEDLLSGEGISGLNISYDAPGVDSITLVDTGNKFGIDFDSAASEAAKKFLDEHGLGGDNTSLTEAFKKYEAGTATPVELTATMMAKGIVKTTDDGIDIIKDDGSVQHFSSENDPGYIEALHKAASVNALEELGVDGKIKYDGGTHEATSTYKIGKKTVNVSSKDGKISYHSDITGQDYDTPEALRDAEYENALSEFRKGYISDPGTKEEFEHKTYGFKLDISANIETSLDEEGLKQQALAEAQKPVKIIKEAINDPNNNNYTVTPSEDGKTVTIDMNGIQVTVDNIGTLEEQIAAAQAQIDGVIDPDGWIAKISAAIQNAFQTLNIAQLFIDGLTESLNVEQNNETGEISFTENPTITALGENLGKGMAAGIASAASTGIKTYFDTEGNQVAIAEPLKTGIENAAESTEVTDADYTIPSATATLTKMTIDQVDEVGFSAPSLGDLVKALVGGTKTSDLTLDSATAAVKKLSLVSVDETDLQTQLTAEVEAKIEPIDVSSITTANDAITQTIITVSASLNTLKESISNLDTNSISANTSATALNTTLTDISNSTGPARAEDFKESLNAISQDGPSRAFSYKEAVNALASYGPQYAANFVNAVNSLIDHSGRAWGFVNAANSLMSRNISISVTVDSQAAYSWRASWAKGNVALSKGSPAMAGGSKKTLMGELGPELVVANGKYYVVGQNGAEMVDLPNDAIVFNHLQTKRLLEHGKSGRGKPVTTEKNAVSYATGNVSGPAMVSAQAAIASLKQLRAMWESMLNATAQQLGSQAGKSASKPSSSKDSSGNNKGDTVTAEDGTRIKTTTAEIQRWYNLLRQIDKTEKDITYQEKLQTQYQSLRVADGKSLYKSYKAELAMLEDQVARSQELADLQKSWYDTKRAELAASAYGKIFRYTEDGLQQYVDGANKGLDILEKLTEADIWGNPTGYATSAETQLSYIQSLGFDLSDLLSNSDGTKVGSYIGGVNYIIDEDGALLEGQDLINAQVSIMENFWDNIDGWRDELDGLYDSYREQLSNVLDNQNKQNEIMQKIVDNQIEVENKVYQALVDARQAIIDNAQKELDAYQKNSEDMIESLNKSLEKERQLYNNQQNSNELLKLQRQLAILQRSGGSTAQILNLQNQIATKQQDMYFDEKEQQIQALQEASDLQIEKMEEQIALMTETLEYEKENGLLWKQVYDIMQRGPEDILGFIAENSADWASNSALQISQDIADLQTKIQVYVSSRDDNFLSYYNDISSNIHDIAEVVSTYRSEALNYNNDEVSSSYVETPSRPITTSTPSNSYTSGSNNSGNGNNNSNDKKYFKDDVPNNYYGLATLNEGSTTTYKMGSDGYFKGTKKSIGHSGDEVSILEETSGTLKDGRSISLIDYKGKKYYVRNERLEYKNGGLIDFTGPAWVDGSPSQPESILSAKETKFVQNNLPNFLSNIDTLQERLIDMQDLQASWLNSISRIIDTNNAQSEGVNIEHVELNMNVEQMSNSADAKKLGKEVLDELLSLSRKSGRNSVSRR